MSRLKNDEIEKFIKGDDSIFPKIFASYRNKINYLAVEILHNDADCEEVVQNTFIKVIARRGELRDASAFNSWIYRIAYNTSLDLYRKNKRGASSSNEYDIENYSDRKGDMDDVVRKKAILDAIQTQIDELPEESRQLAVLRFVGDCSIEEISEIMNIPTGTVKSRLHRTKIKLREGLKLRNVTPATYLGLTFAPLTFRLYSSLVKYQSLGSEAESKIMQTIESTTGVTAGATTAGATWVVSSGLGIFAVTSAIAISGFGAYTVLNPIHDQQASVVAEMEEIDYLKELTNENIQVVMTFDNQPESQDIVVTKDNMKVEVVEANETTYMFIAKENGSYKIKYKDVEQEVVIDNIDKEAPTLKEISKEDGMLILRGNDNLSGIDFEKSYIQEGNEKLDLIKIDDNACYVKGAIKDKAKLRLYDKTGNYQTFEIEASEIEAT